MVYVIFKILYFSVKISSLGKTALCDEISGRWPGTVPYGNLVI